MEWIPGLESTLPWFCDPDKSPPLFFNIVVAYGIVSRIRVLTFLLRLKKHIIKYRNHIQSLHQAFRFPKREAALANAVLFPEWFLLIG